MTFSVVIPAYKSAFIQEAVDSVLNQTWQDWELIVVDDASPEDLKTRIAPALSDSRVKYYRNDKNIGAVDLVDNWNKCLDYCSGDYVICIGDDDRLLPECLADYALLIERYPDYGLYHTGTEIINEDGVVIERLEQRPKTESALEMLLARWKGRKQFIGDFCFDLKNLRSRGGFFKLPLAWGSDEISAFIAAKSSKAFGVANVSVHGFQYRINRATISSSTNYELKVSAMMQCADWYREELTSMVLNTAEESVLRDELLSMLDGHFRGYALQYVRADVAGNHSRLFFWLNNTKLTRLSFTKTLIQGLKGILK